MTKVECFVIGQVSRSIAAVDKPFHRFLITNTSKPPSNRRLQLTPLAASEIVGFLKAGFGSTVIPI
jgi:hypothetical protein